MFLAYGWWGDFVQWIEGHEASAQILFAFVLATITGFYWWTTRRQAKATVDMAQEMREQRMAEDEPALILDIIGQELPPYLHWHAEWEVLMNEQTGEVVSPWPLPECTVRVHNAGRGAAISVEACYLQTDKHYFHDSRGFLLKGDSATFEISGLPAPFGGRSSWAEEALTRLGPPKPAFVIAGYEDVHGRAWVSYLDLDWDPGMTPHIVPLKQGRLRLGEQT